MSLPTATQRWVQAGLIDSTTASRIVAFENQRDVEHRTAMLILAGFFLVFIAAGTLFWTISTASSDSLTAILKAASVIVGAVGFVLVLLSRLSVPPAMRVPLGVGVLLGAIGWIYFYFVHGDLNLGLTIDLVVMGIFAVLLVRRKYPIMAGISGLYIALALTIEPLQLNPWLIGPLGFAPGLIWTVNAGMRKFLKTRLGKIFHAWLLRMEKQLTDAWKRGLLWVGRWRLFCGLFLLLALGIVYGLSRLPGFDRVLLGQLNLHKWIFTGIVVLFLSLIPKETPAFSLFFSSIAWLLIGMWVVRMGHSGPFYSLEGTQFHPWKLGFGAVMLVAAGRVGVTLVEGKKSFSEVLSLGPVGFVGVITLIALS